MRLSSNKHVNVYSSSRFHPEWREDFSKVAVMQSRAQQLKENKLAGWLCCGPRANHGDLPSMMRKKTFATLFAEFFQPSGYIKAAGKITAMKTQRFIASSINTMAIPIKMMSYFSFVLVASLFILISFSGNVLN